MISNLRTIGLAAALALVAGQAQAVSSLNFVWAATNSPTITVSSVVDTEIRGDIVAVGDAAGISGVFVSFEFDADLGDELNIAPKSFAGGARPGGTEATTNLPGGGNAFNPGLPGYTRNQIESTPGNAGLLGSYDVTSGGSGLVSATRTLVRSSSRRTRSTWSTMVKTSAS